MYLGNPLLPINFTSAGAADSVKKELSKRNWREIELKPLRLDLVPYFLFNYHYFIEAESNGHKVVKKSIDGILAVDGHNVSIREDLVELLKSNWKKAASGTPKGAFDEKWCNIEKKDQEEVLKMKTAEHFEVPKGNVVISSARKMFLPLYKTSVSLGGKEYKLIINGVDGAIEGIDAVPDREKGYLELTSETINDLKTPANWGKYAKEIVGGGISAKPKEKKFSAQASAQNTKSSKGVDLSFLDSKLVFVLIMLLALFLIFLGMFRIKGI
ncbi:Uncharacterised protein [uncultured archaeon]|nr:Uncharacterised protein [uncultured archaeon]